MKNTIYFIIPTIIWSTTWFAIKFQLGIVDPVLSVAYRFTMASAVFFAICKIFKLNLKYSFKQHFFIFLQAVCFYSFNFLLIYIAEKTLKSGLVAVIFSIVIFFVIFLNSILLKGKLKLSVIIGAVLGFSGTYLVFMKDLNEFGFTAENTIAILFCIGGVVLAALGNILSSYNQKSGIPVIQTNTYGMLYGALIMYATAIISGIEFNFDMKPAYIGSLFYVTIFGSIISTTVYLKLLGRIGPDRSSYIMIITPIIAMLISTLFEDYIWQKSAIFGIILVITGNYFALNKKIKFRKIFTNGSRKISVKKQLG